MSTVVVCDNVYQLHVARALQELSAWGRPVRTLVSVGGQAFGQQASVVAAAERWDHLHVECPASFWGQVAKALTLRLMAPRTLRETLRDTTTMVLFNDAHPCVAQVRHLCPAQHVSLVEEGTGLHRTRPVARLSPRQWLAGILVRGLNVTGRQGESPWITELWTTQTHALTAAQASKAVRTFDRRVVIDGMQRSCSADSSLPSDDRPVVLLLGQPLVEDHVLTRGEHSRMLTTLNAALDGATPGMIRAYKPHPRERAPRDVAVRALGPGVSILDQHTPFEAMNHGRHPLFVLTFTSGAVRQLADRFRCVSLARCFPVLSTEIGDEKTFPGTEFADSTGQLRDLLQSFLVKAAAGSGSSAPSD